jgi:DNA-binding response OmpR family regulator
VTLILDTGADRTMLSPAALEHLAAGLALFDRHRYDLVLTDFLMPGLTGAQVVEALQERDPTVKLVMLKGSAAERDVARVRERGVTVLAKPVSIDHFSAVIEEVLRGTASEATDRAASPAAAAPAPVSSSRPRRRKARRRLPSSNEPAARGELGRAGAPRCPDGERGPHPAGA